MSLTSGQFVDERQCAVFFDVVAAQLHSLFKMYREVSGTLVQPRPGQALKGVRIDHILVPTDKAVEDGWNHGIVGVELKRSGKKLGPVVAQAIDYSRAVYTLPGNFQVWLNYVFIFPAAKESGDLASILAQNRIGTAESNDWHLLRLATGEANLFTADMKQRAFYGTSAAGNKVGSR